MTKSCPLLVAVFIVTTLLVSRPGGAKPSAPALQDEIYAALTGSWTGQLEYRDFESNQRVVLPTWLEVKPSANGKSLQFAYTYDDGPTKTVTELSTVTIDRAKYRFTITSDRDHSIDTYEIGGLDAIKAGRGKLILTGAGQENDKQVDVRITMKIDRNLYQFTKETKLPGQAFNFRDGYILTRRVPSP